MASRSSSTPSPDRSSARASPRRTSPASHSPASRRSSPAGPNAVEEAPDRLRAADRHDRDSARREGRGRGARPAPPPRIWSLSPSTSTTARGASPPASARRAAARAASSERDRGCSSTPHIFATRCCDAGALIDGEERGDNAGVDDILPGLNDALEAMNRGDVEPAVALLDPDVDWRGRPQGHLWWRHSPSCHGPDEARMNLELPGRQGSGEAGRQASSRWSRWLRWASAWWSPGAGTMADGSNEAEGRFYQVLRVREGLIVDIQGCTSRRAAMAYARRAA